MEVNFYIVVNKIVWFVLFKKWYYLFLKFYSEWLGNCIYNFFLGDFYRKFLRILFSGIMFFVDDLDEREFFFSSEVGIVFFELSFY